MFTLHWKVSTIVSFSIVTTVVQRAEKTRVSLAATVVAVVSVIFAYCYVFLFFHQEGFRPRRCMQPQWSRNVFSVIPFASTVFRSVHWVEPCTASATSRKVCGCVLMVVLTLSIWVSKKSLWPAVLWAATMKIDDMSHDRCHLHLQAYSERVHPNISSDIRT